MDMTRQNRYRNYEQIDSNGKQFLSYNSCLLSLSTYGRKSDKQTNKQNKQAPLTGTHGSFDIYPGTPATDHRTVRMFYSYSYTINTSPEILTLES